MMQRREFLLGAAALRSPKKPNIVLFVADDLARTAIEPYGGKQVPTPHLVSLARQGLCLDRMFTATAMCAPLRQQLLTGLFPVRNGAFPNHSRVYDGVKGLPIFFRQAGYRVGRVGKKHFGPDESFPFDVIGQDNEEPEPGHLQELEGYIRRDPQQPFFLWIASHQPHMPWTKGRPADFPPATLTPTPDLFDHPSTREAMSQYFAEIAWMDTQLGAVLKLLDDTGQSDNTIFVFVTEHGAQFPFSKWTCYDAGLHAGCIVRWPGQVKPGTRNAALTQYVDMLPTLLEAAGVKPPPGLDGRSFLNVLLGKTKIHAEYVYGVQTTKGIINGTDGYPIRSVRDRRYKYIRNLTPEREFQNILTAESSGRPSMLLAWEKMPQGRVRAAQYRRRPPEELYDLEADPYELKNLIAEPRLTGVKTRLSQKLDAFMRQQGDLGLATEMRAGERRLKGAE